MKKIVIAAFVLLLLPCFLLAQEYPIHITAEGHVIVQVDLGDSIQGNFILDTGAGANVVSGKLFQRIAATASKAGYFTGFRHDGDRLDGAVYEIPFLAIGTQKQLKPIIGVYPPLDDFGIDGLVSLKFFEDKPFTLDFKNQKLSFLSAVEAQALSAEQPALPISLYRHSNILLDIFIPIQLNDSITTLAELDTGSGYGAYIIKPSYIQDLKLDTTTAITQAYTTQLSGDNRTDFIYELASISLGTSSNALRVEKVKAIFREGLIYNALIGSGMFQDRQITIDIPNRAFFIHR